MFKIVQTNEKGKPQLCIVPEAWEERGVLYWPRNKADKLIKNENSKPNGKWFEMPCTLKRANLTSEEAEVELNSMLHNEDTDMDPEPILPSVNQKRPRVLLPRNTPKPTDYNDLAKACLTKNTTVTNQSPSTTDSVYTIAAVSGTSETTSATDSVYTPVTVNTLDNSNQLRFLVNPTELSDISFQLPYELGDQETSQETQLKAIIDNQKQILLNQEVILKKLVDFDVQVETALKLLAKSKEAVHSKNSETVNAPNSLQFEAIDSLEHLISLEEKLKNPEYMKDLLEKFSFICGKSGNEYGLNVCYSLVDKIFTRKFMTLCSWAGGSRGGNEKIPFKIYKNVISLFFSLVRFADSNFTLEQCEQFFKNIIKNSTRRNDLKKHTRSSACKRRPSKLIYKHKKQVVDENKNVEINVENNVVNDNVIDEESPEEETSSD